jgi:hypothetical protein
VGSQSHDATVIFCRPPFLSPARQEDRGPRAKFKHPAAAFPPPYRSGLIPRREWGRPEYGERIMAGLVFDIALMSAFITEIVIAAVSFLD